MSNNHSLVQGRKEQHGFAETVQVQEVLNSMLIYLSNPISLLRACHKKFDIPSSLIDGFNKKHFRSRILLKTS